MKIEMRRCKVKVGLHEGVCKNKFLRLSTQHQRTVQMLHQNACPALLSVPADRCGCLCHVIFINSFSISTYIIAWHTSFTKIYIYCLEEYIADSQKNIKIYCQKFYSQTILGITVLIFVLLVNHILIEV